MRPPVKAASNAFHKDSLWKVQSPSLDTRLDITLHSKGDSAKRTSSRPATR